MQRVYRSDLRCPPLRLELDAPKAGFSHGKQTYRCGECTIAPARRAIATTLRPG